MFGAFTLKDGETLEGFQQAFDAFCVHLQGKGFVGSWRLWDRAHHDGYDTNVSEFTILLEMCFHDHQASLDGWNYIETTGGAIRRLHMAVNRQVKDARFVLVRERTASGALK